MGSSGVGSVSTSFESYLDYVLDTVLDTTKNCSVARNYKSNRGVSLVKLDKLEDFQISPIISKVNVLSAKAGSGKTTMILRQS